MDDVRVATFADLDNWTLYTLLQLRVDVFVVEQNCPYPELDGRDTDAGTRHLWTDDGTGPDAYLRLLTADSGGGVHRIGRVCTRADVRSHGRAAALVRTALAQVGTGIVVLDAQSRLTGWYEGFGFTVDGDEYVEDGIRHVPMRR